MANPAVVVDFVANTKDLNRGFQDAQRSASGFGSKMKGLALGAATAGFTALAASLKVGVEEFAEAQKVSAQTDAVLKSTGKAAGVTAQQVGDLAGALMKKSGVDDEAIQSGENVLLTFTNIRNEAGKGKDIFNQTTAAALDMSVALGTDMKSASMTLGKALNDPIKGMAKLTKQGVTFTEAQKEQAAQMVKAGDTAGAQAIILGELNKEFGGSAEAAGKTLPGQLNILKQQFSNLAGEIVAKLIPVLTEVTKFLLAHKDAVLVVIGVIAALVGGMLAYNAAMTAYKVAQAAVTVATQAWAAAQWLLNVALNANPIGLVVIAIAALVAAFVLAYKHSETFRELVTDAFDTILGAAKAVFGWLRANWPTLLAIITGPVGLAVKFVIDHWGEIRTATTTVFNAVKNAIAGVFSAITGTVSAAVDAVRDAVTGAWNAIRTATGTAFNAVKDKVDDVIHDVKTALNALAAWVTGFAASTLTAAVDRVEAVWNGIKSAAESAIHAVKTAFNDLVDWLGGLVERLSAVVGKVANAIKAPINAVLSAWNSLSFTIPKITIPKIKIPGTKKTVGGGSFGGQTFPFPNIPLLAKGAVLDSPTLAMVGEAGREIVTPEKLLREIVGERSVEVRVYIGDQELKGLVRTEIVDHDTGLARTLLAGAA